MRQIKKLLPVIILLILFLVPVFGKDNPKISEKSFNYKSSDGRFKIAVKYPQISGLENPAIEKKLNDFFAKKFLTGYEDLYGRKVNFLDKNDVEFCYKDFKDSFGPESTYSIEKEYNIGVCQNNILSVLSSGLAILVPSAHPAKLIDTFTINLNNGKIYEFKDLFKANSDYMKALDEIIKKRKSPVEKNGKSYDFYLTRDELVLINTSTIFAIQGVEERIKFEKIKNMLDEKGPAVLLMKKK